MELFEAGDVVVLKSGGPRMTIGRVRGEVADCVYFDRKTRKMVEVAVLLETVEPYEEPEPDYVRDF